MKELDAKTIEEATKYQMDVVLRKANDAVKNGAVTIEFLCFLREQILQGFTKYYGKYLSVIQAIYAIEINDDIAKKMSKCKTGKELILRFYEDLQKRYLEEQKGLLSDIFSAVTVWIEQQK